MLVLSAGAVCWHYPVAGWRSIAGVSRHFNVSVWYSMGQRRLKPHTQTERGLRSPYLVLYKQQYAAANKKNWPIPGCMYHTLTTCFLGVLLTCVPVIYVRATIFFYIHKWYCCCGERLRVLCTAEPAPARNHRRSHNRKVRGWLLLLIIVFQKHWYPRSYIPVHHHRNDETSHTWPRTPAWV